MFRKGMAQACASGFIAVALVFTIAAPAAAATATGTRLCTGTRVPALTIDSSAPGNGNWTNYDTAQPSTFTFPGGQSVRYSPFQRANWLVTNGSSGFFYVPPTASCF